MTNVLGFSLSEPLSQVPDHLSRRGMLSRVAAVTLIAAMPGCVKGEEPPEPAAESPTPADVPQAADPGCQAYGQRVFWLLQITFGHEMLLPKVLKIRKIDDPAPSPGDSDADRFHNSHADPYEILDFTLPPTKSERWGVYLGIERFTRLSREEILPPFKDLTTAEMMRLHDKFSESGGDTLVYPCNRRHAPQPGERKSFEDACKATGAFYGAETKPRTLDPRSITWDYTRPFTTKDGEKYLGFGVAHPRDRGQRDLLLFRI